MRIYVAYKYTNTPDKEALKQEIIKISEGLESIGHETFLLGRDYQRWDKCSISHVSNTKAILSNLKKSDSIIFYINSNVWSPGMLFEIILSKIFFKKSFFFVKNDVKCNFCSLIGTNRTQFTDISDLIAKLSRTINTK